MSGLYSIALVVTQLHPKTRVVWHGTCCSTSARLGPCCATWFGPLVLRLAHGAVVGLLFFGTELLSIAPRQVLYNMVLEAAQLRPDKSDVLLDLYCGTGTIGLTLARHCKLVVGLDCVGETGREEAGCRVNGIWHQ